MKDRDQVAALKQVQDNVWLTLWVGAQSCKVGKGPTQTRVKNKVVRGRCLHAPKLVGWLTTSKCSANELVKLICFGTQRCARGTDKTGTTLVAAVLRGRRKQLQHTGAMNISTFEPGMTDHEDQSWKNEIRGTPKGKSSSQHVGVLTNKCDSSNTDFRATSVGREFRWDSPAMETLSQPLPHWNR